MKRTTTHQVTGLMGSNTLGIIPAELIVEITKDNICTSLSITNESPSGAITFMIPLDPIFERLREVIK